MPECADPGGAPVRSVPDVRMGGGPSVSAARCHLPEASSGRNLERRAAFSFLPELVSGRGTVRRSRMVEGQTRTGLRDDASNNRVQILEHLSSRNAHRRKPALRKPRISSFIPGRLISARMGLAIDLDHQPRVAAVEVQRIRPGRMLPAELQSARSGLQRLPQQEFGQAHRASQSARLLNRAGACLWRDVLEHGSYPPVSASHCPLPETSSGRN